MNVTPGRPSTPAEPRAFRDHIPPGPPTFRLPREPAPHQFHLYELVRNVAYAAASEGLSLAAVAVLQELAHSTERDGTSRLPLRQLGARLNRSPGTMHHHVKVLEHYGFVEQLGRCRADNRHRLWRVAGMDRRLITRSRPVDDMDRGARTSRDGVARSAWTSRDGVARSRPQLPREPIGKTRASPHQAPAEPVGARKADPAGIAEARRVLRATAPWQAAPGHPGAPARGRADRREPPTGSDPPGGHQPAA